MSFISSGGSRYLTKPVASASDLPLSYPVGALCYVVSEQKIYAFDGNSWINVSTGGDGGSTILVDGVTIKFQTDGKTIEVKDGGITVAKLATDTINRFVALETVLSAATSANTPSTLVKRDATGNFAGGTITASKLISTEGAAAGTDVPNLTQVTNLVKDGVRLFEIVKCTSITATGNVDISVAQTAGWTVDGYALQTGDAILLRHQTDAKQNLVYTYGSDRKLTLRSDFVAGTNIKNVMITVQNGTTRRGYEFLVYSTADVIAGTNPVDWLDVGYVVSIDADGTTIQNTGGVFSIKDGGVTIGKLETSVQNKVNNAIQKGSALTPSRVMITDSTGAAITSGVTSTTLSYLDATSSIQGQLDTIPTISSPLPINKGGTGSSTQNFVDLSANQTVNGTKNFSVSPTVPDTPSTATGAVNANYITANVVLTSGNQSIDGNKTFSKVVTISGIDSDLIVPNTPKSVASALNTTSATGLFCALTGTQSVGGSKTFLNSCTFAIGAVVPDVPATDSNAINQHYGDLSYGQLAVANTWTAANTFSGAVSFTSTTSPVIATAKGITVPNVPTDGTYAINGTYADIRYARIASPNTWTSSNTFNGNVTITAASTISVAPSTGNDITNKTYVDTSVAAKLSKVATPVANSVLYNDSSGNLVQVANNSTATAMYLSQSSSGTPAWVNMPLNIPVNTTPADVGNAINQSFADGRYGQLTASNTWSGNNTYIAATSTVFQGSVVLNGIGKSLDIQNSLTITGSATGTIDAAPTAETHIVNKTYADTKAAKASTPVENSIVYNDSSGNLVQVANNTGSIMYLSQTSAGVPVWAAVAGGGGGGGTGSSINVKDPMTNSTTDSAVLNTVLSNIYSWAGKRQDVIWCNADVAAGLTCTLDGSFPKPLGNALTSSPSIYSLLSNTGVRNNVNLVPSNVDSQYTGTPSTITSWDAGSLVIRGTSESDYAKLLNWYWGIHGLAAPTAYGTLLFENMDMDISGLGASYSALIFGCAFSKITFRNLKLRSTNASQLFRLIMISDWGQKSYCKPGAVIEIDNVNMDSVVNASQRVIYINCYAGIAATIPVVVRIKNMKGFAQPWTLSFGSNDASIRYIIEIDHHTVDVTKMTITPGSAVVFVRSLDGQTVSGVQFAYADNTPDKIAKYDSTSIIRQIYPQVVGVPQGGTVPASVVTANLPLVFQSASEAKRAAPFLISLFLDKLKGGLKDAGGTRSLLGHHNQDWFGYTKYVDGRGSSSTMNNGAPIPQSGQNQTHWWGLTSTTASNTATLFGNNQFELYFGRNPSGTECYTMMMGAGYASDNANSSPSFYVRWQQADLPTLGSSTLIFNSGAMTGDMVMSTYAMSYFTQQVAQSSTQFIQFGINTRAGAQIFCAVDNASNIQRAAFPVIFDVVNLRVGSAYDFGSEQG